MLPTSYLFSNMPNEKRGTALGGKRNGQKTIGRRENQHEEGEGRTSEGFFRLKKVFRWAKKTVKIV